MSAGFERCALVIIRDIDLLGECLQLVNRGRTLRIGRNHEGLRPSLRK